MTTSRLPRRAAVGALLSASLVGTALLASAAEPPCMTFTDPKGDSRPAHIPTSPSQLAEEGLDLTGVTFDSPGTDLQVALQVVNLHAAPEFSLGDAFYARFKHGGKAVELYAYRYNPTAIGDALALEFPQFGMRVAGKDVPSKMKMTYDEKLEKVVFTVPVADLEKATATPAAGSALTDLTAEAAGDNVISADAWDTAAAPKDMTHALGSACGAGGAAAPAPAAPSAAPSAPPAPPAGGAPAAAGAPMADCFTAKDPKGDAKYAGQAPYDADMDITGLTLGTTADALVAYFKVEKLAAGPSGLDGHRFAVNFTFNKHTFTASGSAFKTATAGAVRDGLAATGRVGKVTQLAVDGGPTIPTDAAGAQAAVAGPGFVASGLKYVFDVKTSTVMMSLPLADIVKYGKAPTEGAVLNAVFASASADSSTLSFPYDTVPDGGSATASKLTYTMGDNACFAPATPPLSSVGAVKAQFGDTAPVAAKLVDAAGAPVAGKEVTFALGESKATGTTGTDGIAKAALLVREKAGTRSLSITSEGTTISTEFTVLVEKTVLKATGSKGNVTATLTDDDRQPVAGQVITFTSGSKKVTTKTNKSGVAKAGFAPGSAVTVTYAGVAGEYSASKTTARA